MKNQAKLAKVRMDDQNYMDTKLVLFMSKQHKNGTNLLHMRQNRLQDYNNSKEQKEAKQFRINSNQKRHALSQSMKNKQTIQDYENKLNIVAENKKLQDTQLVQKKELQDKRRKDVQERHQQIRAIQMKENFRILARQFNRKTITS